MNSHNRSYEYDPVRGYFKWKRADEGHEKWGRKRAASFSYRPIKARPPPVSEMAPLTPVESEFGMDGFGAHSSAGSAATAPRSKLYSPQSTASSVARFETPAASVDGDEAEYPGRPRTPPAMRLDTPSSSPRRNGSALAIKRRPSALAKRDAEIARKRANRRENIKLRRARSPKGKSGNYVPPGHKSLRNAELEEALWPSGPCEVYSTNKHEWMQGKFLEYYQKESDPSSRMYRVQIGRGRIVTTPRTRIRPVQDSSSPEEARARDV